ncbi:MAG: hypothetical protein N2654_04500 [Deltaproteobacteria bacterium]|nr:hypothetical protein [Deltaproteobacteria bacterium]
MGDLYSVRELIEIESRLEHLESLALWIAKETANSDLTISQTGTLISIVCEDVRERVIDLVRSLEEKIREFQKVIQ